VNELELEALNTPLSNLARVVYCVYLRPQLAQGSQKVTINNKAIISLVNNKKEVISLGRQVTTLIKELYQVGLVQVSNDTDFSHSLHMLEVSLPLTELPQSIENPLFHNQHKSMRLDWRPIETLFNDLCQLVGLIETTYSADELGEFIAYWLGRVDSQCTEYQWTQKLVIHLKQRRQRLPLSQQKTAAGHQYVTPSAGIVFDDNVKKLIDQYKDQI
jgi:DNA replication protein DnaT